VFIQSTNSFHRPRKISAVIAPHGFKFERGRIVEQDGGATDKSQGQNGAKVKASVKRTKKAAKTLRPSKRRKFEEEKEESEDEDANFVKYESESAVEERDGPEEGGASDEDNMKPEVE
jgi:hypothetical protein